MPRILRSQGIYYLFRFPQLPTAPVDTTINVRCVAVGTARRYGRAGSGTLPLQGQIGYTGLRQGGTTEFDAGGSVYQLRWPIMGIHPPQIVLRRLSRDQVTQTVSVVRTRPRPTRYKLSRPATLEPWAVALRERTLRTRLISIRPPRTIFSAWLRGPVVVRVPSVQQQQQTLRKWLVRGRRPKTTSRLRPPTVVTVVATFEGPRVWLTPGRRPRTWTQQPQQPPFLTQPPVDLNMFFVGVAVDRRVANPKYATHYKLRPPAVIREAERFFGPKSRLVRIRPRHTLFVLRPPTVVRVPSVEQAEQTIRVRLVQTRPRKTLYRLRPPAVVEASLRLPDRRLRILTNLVRTRPRPTTKTLRKPATLEPSSVQLQERTIRVRLVQIRPRRTTLKLRPPAVLAPEVTTLRVALTTARPRHTIWTLRPPTVVLHAPEVTQQRVTLARQSRGVPRSILRPPTVIRAFVEPLARPIQVALAAVALRVSLIRRAPHSKLRPFGPTRQRGRACLIDVPVALACLDDAAAMLACLSDLLAAEGCLTDTPAAAACLDDLSAAIAKLCDKED